MARRRSKRTGVRGKPNYLWINTAGDMSLVNGQTTWDSLLVPADWSGTVTETQCTLLRLVVTVYTICLNQETTPIPHAQNACIVLGSASEGNGFDPLDISEITEWPDFFAKYDRVLRIFRLEWNGETQNTTAMPVQFSQLPDPVMNLKTPRLLRGDDSVRLCVGGRIFMDVGEYGLYWFARSLVRIGLR